MINIHILEKMPCRVIVDEFAKFGNNRYNWNMIANAETNFSRKLQALHAQGNI